MTDADLAEQIQAQAYEPVYMTTKGQIWDYLLDKHNGDRKAAASEAASVLSGESSGKAYRYARRNFEGGRENSNPKGKGAAKWEEMGKKFPPIDRKPPKGGVKVHVQGHVKVSGGRKDKKGKMRGNGWAKANFTVTLSGTDAYNPTFDAIFSDYFTNFEENPVTDFDVRVWAEAIE